MDKLEELKELHGLVEFEVKAAVRNNHLVPWDKVRDLYDQVGAYVTANIAETPAAPTGFSATKINKYISSTNYLGLADTTIYKPRGCAVTLKDYGLSLLEEAKLIADFEKEIFEPFLKWTNQCLSDPKKLGTIEKAKIAEFNNEAAIGRLDRFVQADSQETMGRYGNLIDRQRDWNELETIDAEIQRTLSKVQPARILKMVKSIKASTDLLIDQIDDPQSPVVVSKETADLLSDRIYECALACAFLGRISTMAIGYNEALTNNVERIKTITQ